MILHLALLPLPLLLSQHMQPSMATEQHFARTYHTISRNKDQREATPKRWWCLFHGHFSLERCKKQGKKEGEPPRMLIGGDCPLQGGVNTAVGRPRRCSAAKRRSCVVDDGQTKAIVRNTACSHSHTLLDLATTQPGVLVRTPSAKLRCPSNMTKKKDTNDTLPYTPSAPPKPLASSLFSTPNEQGNRRSSRCVTVV